MSQSGEGQTKRSLLSTAGLAQMSARRPWRVILAWVLILVLAGVSASGLGDVLTTDADFTNSPESVQGADRLEDRLRGEEPITETVLVNSETTTVDDPAFRAVVEQTTADLRALTGVVQSVGNYYESGTEGLVSADRHTTILSVTMVGDLDAASDHADEYLTTVAAHSGNGIEVLTAGDVSINEEFVKIAEEDLQQAETIGLPVALLVLIVVFGALIAAGIPVILAIASIFVAVGLTALVGRVFELSFFVVNMITMIGLAVGIDYALFIISRYREERERGIAKQVAIVIAGGTASKAVLFSGTTVVLALAGMFLVPMTIFRSLGAGAILVVIVAVAAMLTLVPAMLSLLGDRIDWPRRRKYAAVASAAHDAESVHTGFWGTITRIVMARPIISAALAVTLLVALVIPYFDLNRGQSGIESLPDGEVKSAYTLLSRQFSAGVVSPVEIVVDGAHTEQVDNGINALIAELGQDATFGAVDPVQWNEANDLALISVPLKIDSSTPAAVEAIERLRNDLVPAAFNGVSADVFVTGDPAFNADFEAMTQDYTPIVFAFVLGLSFLLLTVAFRSIVVPATAIIMNLLSVGAAYGLLVLVFQKGYGAGFLGFQETPVIEVWIPIFLFCILFGLSMDYHVFLLSRIREHFDGTGRNRESVAVGLQRTAKIITGAALIMVAVFAGFATGEMGMMQQMGFGLAVAVFIDATVVRSVLVPSTMALLGTRNWYLPSWLAWLPDLRIEGVRAPQVAPVPVPVPVGAPMMATGDDD